MKNSDLKLHPLSQLYFLLCLCIYIFLSLSPIPSLLIPSFSPAVQMYCLIPKCALVLVIVLCTLTVRSNVSLAMLSSFWGYVEFSTGVEQREESAVCQAERRTAGLSPGPAQPERGQPQRRAGGSSPETPIRLIGVDRCGRMKGRPIG